MGSPPPAHTPAPAAHRAPPAPPSLPGDFQDAAAAIERRLVDVEQYQVPQLAQCRGPLSFHNELATAIRQELARARRDLDELKIEADDLDRAKERVAASQLIASTQRQIDSCTKAYRQAVVASKRQIDASAHLVAREELFASSSGRGSPAPGGSGSGRARSPMPGQSGDDALMQATSDVTEGLRRTLQLMQQEVDRSMTSNELLESQTQTMQLTSNQYSTLSSLMNTSKTLITTLERSNILDRLVLFGAFAFFAAVCAHIFKKRVIDRGVHVVGALGGIVAKGGNAIAGVARKGGSAEDVAGEAKQIVKQGVADEWAKATAVAAGAAGAIRAGIDMARSKATQALSERNIPTQTPSGYNDDVETDYFGDLLPEEEEPVAAPVQAREAVDEAGEPVHVVDEDMNLDEPIPGAAPSGEAFAPVVSEPLDTFEEEEEEEDFAEEDAFSYGIGGEAADEEEIEDEEGDSSEEDELVDLDEMPHASESAIAAEVEEYDLPLADEAEPVALRQPHPPTPSLPDLPDLAFETPSAAEMPVQKPDLEEAVAAAAQEEEEDTEVDGESEEPSLASPEEYEEERTAVESDLAEADTPSEASADEAGEQYRLDDEPVSSTYDESHSDPGRSHLDDLPTDYSDLDLDAAPTQAVPVTYATEDDELHLPDDFAAFSEIEADLPREVAGVEGTTIPLDVVDLENAPPALDVEETGDVVAEDSLPQEDSVVELPVDFDAEQTLWTEAARAVHPDIARNDDEEPQGSSDDSYEPEEQADEALLEELLERQMGGVGAGGGYLPVYASYNDTSEHVADGTDAEELTSGEVDDDLTASPTSEEAPRVSETPQHSASESLDVQSNLPNGIENPDTVASPIAASTLEPTPSPASSTAQAVPEPTPVAEPAPMHELMDDDDDDDFVDAGEKSSASLDEGEAAEDNAAEPAAVAVAEPTSSLPVETAASTSSTPEVLAVETTLPAVVDELEVPTEEVETIEEALPLPAHAAYDPPTSIETATATSASYDAEVVDLDSDQLEQGAFTASTPPPPIPDHSVVANPKASTELEDEQEEVIDLLELMLHDEIATATAAPISGDNVQPADGAEDEIAEAAEASPVATDAGLADQSKYVEDASEESENSGDARSANTAKSADYAVDHEREEEGASEGEDFDGEGLDGDGEDITADFDAPPVHVEL
ncbi:hypothetical protein JCM10908_006405 [Rhodotorula pacifica]|uniref:uncharacterized protein n=1 Tax=Rhodotorula pacifica TaxID=1495444 RepID=UPI00316BBDBE